MAPRLPRLESIKSRILALALAATLVPALTTAVLSYQQNRRALVDKFAEQLQSASNQTGRELDLWIKERQYDVRVFASSYEVSENVGQAALGRGGAHTRLTEYLNSVRRRFGDYASLQVVSVMGRPVASSTGAREFALTPDVLRDVRTHDAVLGEPVRDSATGKLSLTITVPITAASGTGAPVGALSATIQLTAIDDMLKRFAPGDSGEVLLVMRDGAVMASSRALSLPLASRLSPEALAVLRERASPTVEYTDHHNVRMVGALAPVVRSTWSVVAQVPRHRAFAEITSLRNTTIVTLLLLLAIVGGLAYTLGTIIVRPLDQLMLGVREVGGGNYNVDLLVKGGGEVAYLTTAFNDMVKQVRDMRLRLEHLSVTDGLTGLANRRHLMEQIEQEFKRADRSKHPFTIMLMDVDHFKDYNDTHGHQAGDAALACVGKVIKECVRDVDRPGRYGGEEFAVLLPETGVAAALVVAERIRARMEKEDLPVKKGTAHVSLSIGVAECPSHAESVSDVVAVADAALYESKRKGRNRVSTGKRGSRRMSAMEKP